MIGSWLVGAVWACRLDRCHRFGDHGGVSGPEPSSDAELIAALQEANAELRKANAALREVINTQAVQIETLTGQVEALSAQLAAQVARIAELERRLGSDSTTSSKPPSSDPPVPQAGTSLLAHRLGRRPGKQPGTGGTTMPLVDDPNETLVPRRGSLRGLRRRPDRGADGTGGASSGHRHRSAPAAVRDRVPDPHPHLPLLRERAGRCGARTVRRPAPSTGPGCSPRPRS